MFPFPGSIRGEKELEKKDGDHPESCSHLGYAILAAVVLWKQISKQTAGQQPVVIFLNWLTLRRL